MPAPLPPDVRQRLQAIVIERVLSRFGGDPKRQQSAAARALKVTPSAINRLVNQGVGGSVTLIERVEKLLNEPKGTILGYTTAEPPAQSLRELPGFAEAIDEAERRAKSGKIQVSRKQLEMAGDWRLIPPPSRLTPDLLLQLALTLSDDESAPKRRGRKK